MTPLNDRHDAHVGPRQTHVRRRAALAGALALALAIRALPAVAADAEPFDLAAELEAMVGLQPGGAAAIVRSEGEVTEAATGVINADGDPITVDTPIFLASASTPLSATMVLQLVDEGKVDLDKPVRTYLPDVEPLDPAATVRDLLTFREGSPFVYVELMDAVVEDPDRVWTTAEHLEFADRYEGREVGQPFPTMTGGVITWLLIEALDGRSYAESLSARIAEPLGLESTGFISSDASMPDGMGVGWSPQLGFLGDPSTETTALDSLGEAYASARDLLTFVVALNDGRLLSEESTSLMFDRELDAYSAGLATHETLLGPLEDDLPRLWGVRGLGGYGHSTVWATDPASGDVAVIVASNLDLRPSEVLAAWHAAGRGQLEPIGDISLDIVVRCPC